MFPQRRARAERLRIRLAWPASLPQPFRSNGGGILDRMHAGESVEDRVLRVLGLARPQHRYAAGDRDDRQMQAGADDGLCAGDEFGEHERVRPGSQRRDFRHVVHEFEQVINDPNVQVKLSNPAIATAAPTPPSPEDTELFRALTRQARATFPGAEVTPYLFQAGTDAGAWRNRGVPVYGIYPYPITDDQLTRMHGNDENVSIESLRLGTDMIYKTLVDVAAKK